MPDNLEWKRISGKPSKVESGLREVIYLLEEVIKAEAGKKPIPRKKI